MLRLPVLILAMLSAIGLGGCEIRTEKPVYETAAGVLPAGDLFTVFKLNAHGGLIDTKGKYEFAEISDTGAGYEISGGNSDLKGTLSFHPVNGLPFDYILQQTRTQKSTAYYGVNATGTGFDVYSVKLNNSSIEQLEAEGIDVKSIPFGNGDTLPSNPTAVETAIKTWVRQVSKNGIITANPVRFRLTSGQDDFERMIRKAKTEQCLAAAGHPLEPMVKTLPGKFAYGIAMDRLDPNSALVACGWGSEVDAPDEVRFALARIHLKNKDYNELIEVIQPLVTSKYPLAVLPLVDWNLHGGPGGKDPEQALKLLEAQAKKHPAIAYVLATYLADGIFGERDYDRVYDLLQNAASADIAAARTGLGMMYSFGWGVEKDHAKALSHYQAAVDGKDLNGSVKLGLAHYYGRGTAKDLEAAYGLFKSAALAGSAEAQYLTGFLRLHGQGTKKSVRAAVNMFDPAVEAGHSGAKAELGRLTYLGEGTRLDKRKGHKLLSDSAKAGNKTAAAYLTQLGLEQLK